MNFGFMRNRFSSLSVLIFMAALLIYPALERKIQVGLWHLWNGNTTRLQAYDIPIPESWVTEQTLEGSVILFEVENTRNEFVPWINISSGSKDTNLFLTMHEQWLRSEGAQIFDRRTIDFDGEKADCIVSNALIHNLSVPSDMVMSVDCESTAGLSIRFSGDKENIDTFYSVVSQMRKHKTPAANNVK